MKICGKEKSGQGSDIPAFLLTKIREDITSFFTFRENVKINKKRFFRLAKMRIYFLQVK